MRFLAVCRQDLGLMLYVYLVCALAVGRFLAETGADRVSRKREDDEDMRNDISQDSGSKTEHRAAYDAADADMYKSLDFEEAAVARYFDGCMMPEAPSAPALPPLGPAKMGGKAPPVKVESGDSADGHLEGSTAEAEAHSPGAREEERAVAREREGKEAEAALLRAGGWGEARGHFRERAAWPLPPGQKFVHVDHDAEAGMRIEFVGDEDSSGSSDPDFNKAQLPAGWKGAEPEGEQAAAAFRIQEAEEWDRIVAPDEFPQHGYSMAHGKKWEGVERGATGEHLSPMLATPRPNPAALQPHMAGVRHWQAGDPRLAPGGLVYEAALEVEGGQPLRLGALWIRR